MVFNIQMYVKQLGSKSNPLESKLGNETKIYNSSFLLKNKVSAM
jgi:hypothetical protein